MGIPFYCREPPHFLFFFLFLSLFFPRGPQPLINQIFYLKFYIMANLSNSSPSTTLSIAHELCLSYKKSVVLEASYCKGVNSSLKVSTFLRAVWHEEILVRESFYILCLNAKCDVIGFRKIADGGIDAVVVDCRIVFSTALLCNATSIILAHNHPSGTLNPSSADRLLTTKIKNGGEILNIKVLDHIILTEDSYYSFADNGEL